MKTVIPWLFLCLVGLATGNPGFHAAAFAQTKSGVSSRHLADYDAELRLPDGRVDTDGMVQRLKELGVTTYYWLVWHAPTDWEDLKVFLPKAAKADIEVWVYLVPPSEQGPAGGYPAPEPFKNDFSRWAEEIARLSLQSTNLAGWVIDDFYANHQLFTPAYVKQMQAKARKINPGLLFRPLMYFPEITWQFIQDYHEAIDGVVASYPPNREEIIWTRALLNGKAVTSPMAFVCPWNTPTRNGDYVSAGVRARVLSGKRVCLRFQEQDDFILGTAGYHFKQLLVNNAVVWEEDVAGGAHGWRPIEAEATKQVGNETNVTVAFRLVSKNGVGNFGVRWWLKDLRTEGLELAESLDKPQRWAIGRQGPFAVEFASHTPTNERPIRLPFIVMTAAQPDEFRARHGEPASPERIAAWLKFSLEAWKDGYADGVVTYCLDKSPTSQVFPLAQKLFQEYRSSQ